MLSSPCTLSFECFSVALKTGRRVSSKFFPSLKESFAIKIDLEFGSAIHSFISLRGSIYLRFVQFHRCFLEESEAHLFQSILMQGLHRPHSKTQKAPI